MTNTYKDILSQHPVGPEKLVFSRNNLTFKEIAPDYISFWDENGIDSNKYKITTKSFSLSNPTNGKLLQLKFSLTSKKLYIHSEWFWNKITFKELYSLAKTNELNFISFPCHMSSKEKLFYFKDINRAFIPMHFGLFIKPPIVFDLLS